MSMTPPTEDPENLEDPADLDLEEPTPPAGLGALLPRFQRSQKTTSRPEREPLPQSPPPSPEEGPAGPSAAGVTGRSSPTSTDSDDVEELVDPTDLQAAVRQAVDIGFMGVAQSLGYLERKAKDLPAIDERWMPTREEREFVLLPAGRIARRHIRAPAAAMDTIDGCLIATGVAAFSMRAYLGVETIPKERP